MGRTRQTKALVLVEYFFTDSRLLAFVIRPNFRRPTVITITTDVSSLERAVEQGEQAPQEWGRLIDDPRLGACIEPLLQHVNRGDVICFVPSGKLFHVPLHAISVEGAPLIARNSVFYAPNAATLRHCVRRRDTARTTRRATVFGNPRYDLDHTIREAQEIGRLLGAAPRFGVAVNRSAWFDAMASSDIIHYAGHAAYDDDDPLASCLYLNTAALTARDLFAFAGAPLRLITLSGCQSGVNRIHAGDELLGLTRALLYAGASSLILTLWVLDDRASPNLMIDFYDRWLNRGERKVDALRHAQLTMLERGWTDPFYWAPYILVGDWR